MMENKRNLNLDVLKSIAMFFVVFLHINGYVMDINGIERYSKDAKLMYLLIEAVAFPAIHIFVLVGSWFNFGKEYDKKRILRVYMPASLVGILACILYGIVAIVCNECEQEGLFIPIFQSVFPFVGRAWWFVTDYIILLFLAPLLNLLVVEISPKKLKGLTVALIFVISILPTFFDIVGWRQDYSLIGLFVLLFFISALFRGREIKHRKLYGILLWGGDNDRFVAICNSN